jgi:hypothetical protein
MHFVLLATHNAEVCPTSNAKTRDLMLPLGPEVPKLAEKNSVNIIAGPLVSDEHLAVVVVEAEKAESVHDFLTETRLTQWNSVRVIPAVPLEEGVRELQELPPLF